MRKKSTKLTERKAARDIQKLAKLTFRPIAIDPNKLATNEEFGERMKAVRVMAATLGMKKRELVAFVKKLDQGARFREGTPLSLLLDTLAQERRFYADTADMFQMATARVFSACAVLGEQFDAEEAAARKRAR